MKKALCLLLITILLQGCAAAGGATVGVASATAIYDRSSIKATLDDNNISYTISQKLAATPSISEQCHIVVSTYHKTVLLMGQAPTQALKQQAEDIAKTVPNIKRLYNEITIEGPTSNLARTNDTWITTKVKTKLLTTDNLKSGQFKVVTENGTVFLMGIATREQAKLAVDATRHVDGVQKVVTIFTFTKEKPKPSETQPSQDAGEETSETGTF